MLLAFIQKLRDEFVMGDNRAGNQLGEVGDKAGIL